MTLYDKIIQISAVFSNRLLFSRKTFCQFLNLLHKPFPDLIDFHDGSRIHASVDSHPRLLPFTESTDTKCDHIVFQDIHLSARKIGHSAPQITKNALITESLHNHFKSGTQILYKRVHQYRMFLIYKKRNSRILKHMACNASVLFQISCNDGNLSITIFLLTNQSADPSCSLLHLSFRVSCLKDLYLVLLFFISFSVVTKQILLQKIQRRSIRKSGLTAWFYPDWFFHILCKF